LVFATINGFVGNCCSQGGGFGFGCGGCPLIFNLILGRLALDDFFFGSRAWVWAGMPGERKREWREDKKD
jgi:hypothetical protein